jgi:hypothetical protein
MRTARGSLAYIAERQQAMRSLFPAVVRGSQLREVYACDLHAGDVVHDKVFGSNWTITGTDGTHMTAVDDDGCSCTMRVGPNDRMWRLN